MMVKWREPLESKQASLNAVAADWLVCPTVPGNRWGWLHCSPAAGAARASSCTQRILVSEVSGCLLLSKKPSL